MKNEGNCCDHGDHPAPAGRRFCGQGCLHCETASRGETGCDGFCLLYEEGAKAERERIVAWLKREAEGSRYVFTDVHLDDFLDRLAVNIKAGRHHKEAP